MNARWRRLLLLLVILVLLVVGAVVGQRWLASWLKQRSVDVVAELCGEGGRITISEVNVDLFAGDVEWHDVTIEHPDEGADPGQVSSGFRISGHVDTVSVHGLSVWRLWLGRTLSVHAIRILHPELTAVRMPPHATVEEQKQAKPLVHALHLDSLLLERASIRVRHIHDDRTYFAVDRTSFVCNGLMIDWMPKRPFSLKLKAVEGSADGVSAAVSPLNDVRAGRIDWSDGGGRMTISDAAMVALKGPEDYQKAVKFETDLIAGRADTVLLEGLDPQALLTTHDLLCSRILVAGTQFDIHRDKTMVDGPVRFIALPNRAFRKLPFEVRVDTLRMARCNIKYHEKDVLTPQYGDLEFADVNATMTHLCNRDTARNEQLVLKVKASAYRTVRVDLEARTMVADSSDRFTVRAKIGNMPISVFNNMTEDLVLMRATAGNIGGIDLTIKADNDQAEGRVDMEYEGLKVSVLKDDGSRKKKVLLSGLINELVHSKNVRSDESFRHGDFHFKRAKDHAIFNYLWLCLREGMLATVIPGALKPVL